MVFAKNVSVKKSEKYIFTVRQDKKNALFFFQNDLGCFPSFGNIYGKTQVFLSNIQYTYTALD